MADKKLYTYILVDNGVDPEQLILWDTLEITIGRNSDRDIVLTSTEVSREHAIFKREGNTYCILDNHTGNGTFVNETQVIRHELKNGDAVRIGDAIFTFKQSLDNPMAGRRGAKYASQLKNFGVPGMSGDEGGRTIMALGDPLAMPGITADGRDLRPSDEMEFQLDDLNAAFQTTYPSRDLDLDDLVTPAAPPSAPATRVAEEFAALELTDEEPAPAPPPAAARPNPAPAAPARPQPAAAAPAATQKRVAPPVAPAAPAAARPSASNTASQRAATPPPAAARPTASDAMNAATQAPTTPTRRPAAPAPTFDATTAGNENAKTVALELQATPAPNTATQPAAQAPVSFTVEIEGLTPELKRALGSLLGKPIALPPLTIRLDAKRRTP